MAIFSRKWVRLPLVRKETENIFVRIRVLINTAHLGTRLFKSNNQKFQLFFMKSRIITVISQYRE